MTEKQWLSETRHAQGMMVYLGDCGLPRTKAGRRRLRLFACGCCRVAWDILPDDRLRDAVVVAERFAEGQASKTDLSTARAAVERLASDSGPFGRIPAPVRVSIDMAIAATSPQAYSAAFRMTATTAPLAGRIQGLAAEAYLCHLTRCVFGNPFRHVAFDSSLLTSTVVALAKGIYEEPAVERMLILADALQDAGCENEDILSHLRGPGPHVRGCWVIDLILGKE